MSRHKINKDLIRCPICGNPMATIDKDCSGINILCKKCETSWNVAVANSKITITANNH